MADLTPRTRSESFLNGEDLEPITRREHFYAGRENDLPEGHQEPETREEWFIQKYREAGDVTVESLSITENGTYTAPSGKAYSPVSVDVPLPENAYLLKSIENVNIATFADGTDNFLKSLEVAIEPQQEGSGEPSPSNVRPISGWDEVDVTVADDVENPTVSNVYTIDLDGTRYGGELDVVNGVLTVEYVIDTDLGAHDFVYVSSANIFHTAISGMEYTTSSTLRNKDIMSSAYKVSSTVTINSDMNDQSMLRDSGRIYIRDTNYSDATAFKNAVSGVQLFYKLATPQTIQLTPTIIKSLQGENNFFASTGEVIKLQYWGR